MTPPSPPTRFAPALASLVLAGIVLALYARGLGYPLVFDDASLTEEFLRAYAGNFRLDLRRFAYGSFGLTYALLGFDLAWLRLGNVLLHAAASVALFALGARLLGALAPEVPATRRTAAAFVGAALFAAHPVSAYAVAYLMQRSIVMATAFSLVALACFLEGLLRRRVAWHLAAVAAYFVAVFSKEHAVMLPVIALALAVLLRGPSWRPEGEPSWRLWRELALPLGLMGVVAIGIVLLQRGLIGAAYEPLAQAAIAQLAESRPSASASISRAPAGEGSLHAASIVNQGALFLRYVSTWLVPWPGAMAVDLRTAFPASWLAWPQLAGFVAWLAWAAAGVVLLLKGGRRGLAGFAMLAPWLLGLTEFVAVRIAEPFVLYRSYLWMSLAPLAAAALLATSAVRRATWIAVALAIALCAALASERLSTFSSEVALWDDAVAKLGGDASVPLADRPVRFRGIAHFRAGRDAEARADFERALAIAPREAENWLARGTLLMRAARSDAALADFDRALQLEPRLADALERRCVVLMRLRRLDDALASCRRALELAPHAALNHTSLGMALALAGRANDAEAAYRGALAMAPSSADTRYQLGVLLAGTGRLDAARLEWRRACGHGHRAACARIAARERP